ncbi:AF4/FMR2 family member 4-like [Cyclospora cayetanensis]|uniref:AF4/FMR2 family member 4-like n=1 Tax=Cyclospora cayetanensis TaxID=88456 RepID=A0A6P6RT21_9EIME|nr:AF4/FMR2 family member 4-like [Cyclospora cayetanensis]
MREVAAAPAGEKEGTSSQLHTERPSTEAGSLITPNGSSNSKPPQSASQTGEACLSDGACSRKPSTEADSAANAARLTKLHSEMASAQQQGAAAATAAFAASSPEADEAAFADAVSLISRLGEICSSREMTLSFDDVLLLRVALELLSCCSCSNSSNSQNLLSSGVSEGSSDLWLQDLPGVGAAAASFFRCVVLQPHVALPLPPQHSHESEAGERNDSDQKQQQQQEQKQQQQQEQKQQQQQEQKQQQQQQKQLSQETADTLPRHVGPFVWIRRRAAKRSGSAAGTHRKGTLTGAATSVALTAPRAKI